MDTIRETTSLHPTTVTDFSRNPRRRRRSRAPGVWVHHPETIEQIDPRLLSSALASAGGDKSRLWFDRTDGSVWLLNHGRMTRCVSPACPACHAAGRRSA